MGQLLSAFVRKENLNAIADKTRGRLSYVTVRQWYQLWVRMCNKIGIASSDGIDFVAYNALLRDMHLFVNDAVSLASFRMIVPSGTGLIRFEDFVLSTLLGTGLDPEGVVRRGEEADAIALGGTGGMVSDDHFSFSEFGEGTYRGYCMVDHGRLLRGCGEL